MPPPGYLADRTGIVVDMLQHVRSDHDVEATGPEREIGTGRPTQDCPPSTAGQVYGLGIGLDTADLPERDITGRVPPGSTAIIENPERSAARGGMVPQQIHQHPAAATEPPVPELVGMHDLVFVRAH
jgi:hypothetical protein